jgi:hypothetical protein
LRGPIHPNNSLTPNNSVSVPTDYEIEATMRSFTCWFALTIFIGAALLSGCGTSAQAACQQQVQAYTQQINPITAEWGSTIQRASSAPRDGLPPAIDSMQAIRQRADSVTIPDCAKSAHGMLTQSMDMQIQGFRDTLANKPSATVQQEFSNAAQAFANFEAEIRRLAGATR